MNEVRPCPFCGSSNVDMFGYNQGRKFHCNNCQAETRFIKQELEYRMGLSSIGNNSNEVDRLFLAAWNRRDE